MVPILANLPILGRFLRVGCSRSFREKTTFVAQNKKNMVNVIVLCIELLLDIVGLVLGILVYSRSSDNNGLTKAWGVLAITLSLLLLCDNLEWMWIFSRGGVTRGKVKEPQPAPKPQGIKSMIPSKTVPQRRGKNGLFSGV